MNNNKSVERVKEQNIRAIALQVVIISAMSIIFKQPILMLLLSADFILRAFVSSKFSPLAIISRKVLEGLLPFRDKIIPLKPKKFAASIGFLLSASAGIIGLAGQIPVMIYLTGVLLLFSSMEAFLKFCAGCWIFSILISLKIIHEDNCTECSLTTVK